MAWSPSPTALTRPARTGWWGEHPTVSIPARRGWWGYSNTPNGVIGAALKTLSASATGTHPYTGQLYVALQPLSASLTGVREGISATLKPAVAALTSTGGGWDTVFYDDFERASLGDDYTVGLGAATITDGVLYAYSDPPGNETAWFMVAAEAAQINDKRVTMTLTVTPETTWSMYMYLAYTDPDNEIRSAAIGYFTTDDGAPADDWYVAAGDDYDATWVVIDPPVTGDVLAMESSDTQIRVRLNSDTLIDWTSSITPNMDVGPTLYMFTNDFGVEDLTIDAPGGGTVEPHIAATLKKLQAHLEYVEYPPFSDTFNRADGALGGFWDDIDDALVIASNMAVPTLTTGGAGSWQWPVTTDSFRVTFTMGSASKSTRFITCYVLGGRVQMGWGGSYIFVYVTNVAFLLVTATTSYSAGDALAFDVTWNGTHHVFTFRKNGTSVQSVTDTSGYTDSYLGDEYRKVYFLLKDTSTAGDIKLDTFTYDDL